MKQGLFLALTAAAMLLPGTLAARGPDADSSLNVNSRYTVQSVEFADGRHFPLSRPLVNNLHALVGERLNFERINQITKLMVQELHADDVKFHILRGTEPGQVRVLFDVEEPHSGVDVAVRKLSYDSRQGWSGRGALSIPFGPNRVSVAVVTDGDELAERYSGVEAKYTRTVGASDRVELGFEIDGYREHYNQATLVAAGNDTAGLYSSRWNAEPTVTFFLTPSLSMTAGASFETLGFASGPSQSANALVDTLRYHREWDGWGASKDAIEGSYSLRAGTPALGSYSGYVKQEIQARYERKQDRHTIEIAVFAGTIAGQAPLFERFVLGNSTMLRGWNKYELDPLGGTRVANGSVQYGYRMFRVFYDMGAIWDHGTSPEAKQSAGAGFQKGAFLVAVAFPLRGSRVEPVLIAGMNF